MTNSSDKLKNTIYGDYEKGTFGSVLNALSSFGIPTTTIDRLRLGSDGVINSPDGVFARYKFFDDIKEPLFLFTDKTYTNYQNEKGYQITLGSHLNPSLVISDASATPEVHDVLHRGLTNITTDPFYKLHQDAGAFFQGGYSDPNGHWFYIEFWNPAHAQKWVDAINVEIKKLHSKETNET